MLSVKLGVEFNIRYAQLLPRARRWREPLPSTLAEMTSINLRAAENVIFEIQSLSYENLNSL